MKKEKDLHKELRAKNFKKMNPFAHLLYGIVNKTKILGKKYNPHIVIKNSPAKCKGPCFLIWNHQSRRDHTLVFASAWPRRVNIVCEYNEFFRKHLHFVLTNGQILPKKVWTNDFAGTRAMNQIIKQNGCVAFSPEGSSSYFGDNMPIVPGTGKFLKFYKIPVYILRVNGSYLTNNKVSQLDKIGRIDAEIDLLFSKEDLEKYSGDEINDIINEEFHHDDYKWNKTARVTYKSNNRMCENMEDMCYKCPKCGKEFSISTNGSTIKCDSCGNGATLTDLYDFVPFDDTCVIPESPLAWVDKERADIIKEIRKDPNYKIGCKVKIGELPKDHLIPNLGTCEVTGEGEFWIDHGGVHYRGTRNNEPFEIFMDYTKIYSLSIVTDFKGFTFYYNEEYFEFIPDKPIVGKLILVCEEMHRLHVNTWKNFPWKSYMYEGLDK